MVEIPFIIRYTATITDTPKSTYGVMGPLGSIRINNKEKVMQASTINFAKYNLLCTASMASGF